MPTLAVSLTKDQSVVTAAVVRCVMEAWGGRRLWANSLTIACKYCVPKQAFYPFFYPTHHTTCTHIHTKSAVQLLAAVIFHRTLALARRPPLQQHQTPRFFSSQYYAQVGIVVLTVGPLPGSKFD